MEFLETSFGRLAYKKHGTGRNVFLLFHGFGQTMKAYDDFLSIRTENDCYLVFDVFYHGQSSWRSANYKLTKEIWRDIIIQLMSKEGFEKFHLIGYSMGGKFSLLTYELFPYFVKTLFLMAPDGIKTGFWYNMATFPILFNSLFKRIVFKPDRFFAIMDFLHNLGILESSLIKFVKSHMRTRTLRAQVYFTWIVFKPLKPNLGKIITMLRRNKTPITLMLGEYDKMITSKNLKKFTSKVPQIREIELPSGHNNLIEETLYFLKPERQKVK